MRGVGAYAVPAPSTRSLLRGRGADPDGSGTMSGLVTADDMRWVQAQADKLAHGWHAAEVAPDTYEDLCESVRVNAGHIVVWSGASERTVYGDAEVNHAFRAWHDSIHIGKGWTFTLPDEKRVAHAQAACALVAGRAMLARVLFSDVAGQAEYYGIHGAFPEDQIAFVAAYMADRDAALRQEF